MTTRAARSTERKPADDRRREIADAALRVIADHGLGRFTALAIAREVGITDAALFRHFPTRRRSSSRPSSASGSCLRAIPAARPGPGRAARAFFRQRVAVIRAHPGIARIFATQSSRTRRRPRAWSGSPSSEPFHGVRPRLVAEAAHEDVLAPGLGVEEASLVVLGAPSRWPTPAWFLQATPAISPSASGTRSRPPRASTPAERGTPSAACNETALHPSPR